MYGYSGRILHVDLARRKCALEEPDGQFARKYLGANGFAESPDPGIDPLSLSSTVFFAVGPVTDTAVPSTCRAYVAAESPRNGLFFDSTFGGRSRPPRGPSVLFACLDPGFRRGDESRNSLLLSRGCSTTLRADLDLCPDENCGPPGQFTYSGRQGLPAR